MINLIDKRLKIVCIILLFFTVGFLQTVNAISDESLIDKNNASEIVDISKDGSEYWALIVAVGVYADNPEENRPLMFEEADDFKELLVESPWWSEDHIKMLKGEESTIIGILQGLRWLDRMEDSDDISVVYITTHGFPLDFDIPPFDEEDGCDEGIIPYWGFAYENMVIWDDILNVFLNRLESEGVCLIVDTCYAGGFNDPPDWGISRLSANPFYQLQVDRSINNWIEGFGEEVRSQGRVVLMASCEDEVSYSGGFAPYLIDGFRGFGDTNMDGIVTAEEAFYYAEPRPYRQNPTIFDGYDGELPIILINDSIINKNIIYSDDLNSIDDDPITSSIGRIDENSIVEGYIFDGQTSVPIDNAYVSIRGRIDHWEYYENETNTDSYGYYKMNIPSGRFRVSAYANGYLNTESNQFELNDYESICINLSLNPRPEETAMIYGCISDEQTSDPIEGAVVDLVWYINEDQYYRNDTVTDEFGFYTMNVAPGFFNLDFDADDYFREYLDDIYIEDEEEMEINVVLYPRPKENCLVTGYILDKDTNEPIVNARFEIYWEDIELYHSYENETFTNEDGFYEINVAAGEVYHDVRCEGYDYYNPYRLDVLENKTLIFDVELERNIFEVVIEKPLNAFYFRNERVMPFPKARIFGAINITVGIYESYFWGGDAQYVEIYIDDELVATLDQQPYNYLWDKLSIGKHTIKAIAYDYQGNSASAQREVYKIF